MTCCPNPAVRRCLLSLVTWSAISFAGWSAVATHAEEAAASPSSAVAIPASNESDDPAPAGPAAGLTGLPPDLNSLSREQLIDLVKDLTLQNQVLAVKLAEQREALANAAPDLQDRIDWQARTIERLQKKLARAERTAAPGSEASAVLESLAGQDPSSAESDGAEATAPTQEPPANANPPWEYRFAYEFGLIRTSGDGHVVLRDENGKRQRHEFDYTEYRRDAVWVSLLIRNDSDQPMRFAGLIELRGEKPFGRDNRERLATHAFRTPLLQPGEVFQINEDELTVDRPWKVDVIELTEVKAFSTPADPDPDPGKG